MSLTLIVLGVLAAVGVLSLVLLGGLKGLTAACKRWTEHAGAKQARRSQDALRRVLAPLGLEPNMVEQTTRIPAIRDHDETSGGVGQTPDLAHTTGDQPAEPSPKDPQFAAGPAERSAPATPRPGTAHYGPGSSGLPKPGRCAPPPSPPTPGSLAATPWGTYSLDDPYRAAS